MAVANLPSGDRAMAEEGQALVRLFFEMEGVPWSWSTRRMKHWNQLHRLTSTGRAFFLVGLSINSTLGPIEAQSISVTNDDEQFQYTISWLHHGVTVTQPGTYIPHQRRPITLASRCARAEWIHLRASKIEAWELLITAPTSSADPLALAVLSTPHQKSVAATAQQHPTPKQRPNPRRFQQRLRFHRHRFSITGGFGTELEIARKATSKIGFRSVLSRSVIMTERNIDDADSIRISDSINRTYVEALEAPRKLKKLRALGDRIGRHKTLTVLQIGPYNVTTESECRESLLRGISQNRSLRDLIFHECHGNWPLEILGPLYKNLHMLRVKECNLSHGAIRSLSTALRGCTDCSLERITWEYSTMSNESSVELIQSMAGLSRLWHLKLFHCNIGTSGCRAMAALLRNPDCTLKEVSLGYNSIRDEGFDALVAGLGDNRTLTKLVLVDIGDITTEAWQSFAGILSAPNCMLERLELCSISIDDRAMVAFADALRGNSRMKCLWLGRHNISSINWAELFGGEQMNRNISPHVLAWIGCHGRLTIKDNYTAVYRFLRTMPTLCGNSCRVGGHCTRKRKAHS